MLMQMLGSFAEFEREMIRERTRAGLDGLSALSGHRYPAWQQISRNPFAYIALDDVWISVTDYGRHLTPQ